MKRLFFLLALTASTVSAQVTSGDPDPRERHVLTVYESGGTLAYRITGQSRADYVWLMAGGELVVRAADGVRALVVVREDTRGAAGTEGKASVEVGPRDPAERLQARARREGRARALRSTFHTVVVLACAEEAVGGECADWQVVPPASGDPEAGLTLRVIDDLFNEPAALRRDPPLEPDPR